MNLSLSEKLNLFTSNLTHFAIREDLAFVKDDDTIIPLIQTFWIRKFATLGTSFFPPDGKISKALNHARLMMMQGVFFNQMNKEGLKLLQKVCMPQEIFCNQGMTISLCATTIFLHIIC